MISPGLTNQFQAARQQAMQSNGQGTGRLSPRAWRNTGVLAMLMAASMLSGCISVTAPDKPIVIELNINIKQEVIYRLSQDAKDTIESNSGIF
ncbi:YnbE family lipoprotein [Novosphingobium sp. PS1R-30]|uniref:YnbE family lipoprotein n=2 Tax=Novosphingobium TaxID=165696 RepID=A0ABU8RZ96_9SPHN